MLKVTGDEPLIPENSTLTGPCRVIEQEYTCISCRAIDVVLPPSSSVPDRLIDNILLEIAQDAPESLVAYRGGQRWVQNFEPLRLGAIDGPGTKLRSNGVYLVTGGLGGIGLAIAEHLARTVQAKIVVIGRSGLPPREQWDQILGRRLHRDGVKNNDETAEKIWQIRAMEEMGSEVLVLSADVSDVEQMQSVVRQTLERFGQLNGVSTQPVFWESA